MSQKRRKTSESPTGDAMADCVLPLDMMLCIFPRLPVKSIHRFKSVCKPLRDVLSSPEFAKMHRAQFPLNPENQLVITKSVIICNRTGKFDNTNISLLKIDSEKKPIPSPQEYYIAKAVYIIGCCNGLICMDYLLGKGKRQIVLWNPALNNMSMCLPVPELEIDSPTLVSIGFGYNEEADDFKVILIARFLKIENSRVAVYSSNTNSWSKIDAGFQFIVYNSKSDTIVNGSPYWEASVDGKLVLVCFDVREMVFKIVPRPNIITEFLPMLFLDWKGDVGAIVCSNENDERVLSIDVWVFNDVGNIGWTKKCSFGSIELNVLNVFWLWECVKNGNILIGDLEDGKRFMFDTENGVGVIDESGNEWWSHDYGEYTESLAYIKGMEKQGMEKPIL